MFNTKQKCLQTLLIRKSNLEVLERVFTSFKTLQRVRFSWRNHLPPKRLPIQRSQQSFPVNMEIQAFMLQKTTYIITETRKRQ